MGRQDFKDTRPLEELIEELFRRGQAEQKALEEEANATGRKKGDSLYLAVAEMLKEAVDPLAAAVEHALYSFPSEAQISLRLLCQADVRGRSQEELESWLSQLEAELETVDADLRTLLKAAIANLRRQVAKAAKKNKSKTPLKCR